MILGRKHPCLSMTGHVPGTEVNELAKQPGPSLQEAHGLVEKSNTNEAVISGKKSREVIGTSKRVSQPSASQMLICTGITC